MLLHLVSAIMLLARLGLLPADLTLQTPSLLNKYMPLLPAVTRAIATQ